jgi:hypothetical protein
VGTNEFVKGLGRPGLGRSRADVGINEFSGAWAKAGTIAGLVFGFGDLIYPGVLPSNRLQVTTIDSVDLGGQRLALALSATWTIRREGGLKHEGEIQLSISSIPPTCLSQSIKTVLSTWTRSMIRWLFLWFV